MKLERAFALDCLPSIYPFHFCVILVLVEFEVLKFVMAVANHDQGVCVNANDKGVHVKVDLGELVR